MAISEAQRHRMAQASHRFDNYVAELSEELAEISEVEAEILATSELLLGHVGVDLPTRSPSPITARQSVPNALFERQIDTDDVVSVEFLEAGLLAKRPVGRIWNGEDTYATGFLVGHDLMMTAAHALPSAGEASDMVFQLDYEDHKFGPSVRTQEYSLDPGTFFLRDPDYDVAICAVTDFAGLSAPLRTYGWHVLQNREETVSQGTPVSIIQHPEGRTKALVVHNSHFVDTDKHSPHSRYCWYTGDTEQGSSGSPVFDLTWRVIALHSSAVPDRAANGAILDKRGQPILINGQEVINTDELSSLDHIRFRANEGIRASTIVGCVQGHSMTTHDQETLRQKLLALWLHPGASRIARKAISDGLVGTLTA